MKNTIENLFGRDCGNFSLVPGGSNHQIVDNGMFICKTANQWIDDAAKRPNPQSLWNDLWFEDEVCCLFADTNLGKSILAVQIAIEIARKVKDLVLYFDFELTDKQFQRRYTNEETGKIFEFPNNLHRVELNPEVFVEDNIEFVLDQIEIVAKEAGSKILIIDNITWLTSKSESGDAAAQLMSRLIQMKKRGGFSVLVLAHTPKRNTNSPLTQNSLAGSKRIANFMDSIFAIGTSKKNRPSSRYIKQIKVRSTEMTYGDDNVIECDIVKDDDFLHFRVNGYGTEAENLDEPDEDKIRRKEADIEIARRLNEHQSYSTIQKEMGVSSKTIAKVSRNLSEYSEYLDAD